MKAVECAVGALRDVKCTPESFDCLKIPSETKTLLSSLAKTRLGLIPTVPFDDVIDGKGRGLNILLQCVGQGLPLLLCLTHASGPPGVGKTFTVEATSELFELPLYSVSMVYCSGLSPANLPRYRPANLLSITEIPMS